MSNTKFEVIHQWSDDPTPTGPRPTEAGVANPAVVANTGLSATLNRKKDSNGNLTNEYTLAIRSTEFRYKNATGLSEVAFNGFALAQLDALEKYYAWLKNTGKLPLDAELRVTGYSLGAHLATIFAEIHQGDIDIDLRETVTFNGAGRGAWDSSKGTPHDMILFFRSTLVDPDFAKGDPLVPFDSFKWAAAKRATRGPFDARSLYKDPRYVWAVYAAFQRYGVDNVVRYFKLRAATGGETGSAV